LIKDLTVSDVKQGNNSTAVPFEFRTVKYELAINPRGWDIEVLHTGFFEYRDDIDLFGDPGVVAPITVQSGASPDGQPLKRQRPSKPQAIDVNAAYFTSVESDTKYYDANWRDRLHWRVFRTKRFTPFSGLNFS
jgi:hypothetical protein